MGKIRENILTESSITDLVQIVDEEMDGVAHEQQKRLESVEGELVELKRRLGRIWHVIKTTDIETTDASDHIREHRERLEDAAAEARANPSRVQGRPGRHGDHHRLRQGDERLPQRERVDRAQGLHRVLRQGDRRHARQRPDALHRLRVRR